jgi:uncharacterized protein YacL
VSKGRKAVIICFAILGAISAGLAAPSLLQSLFEAIQRATPVPTQVIPPPDTRPKTSEATTKAEEKGEKGENETKGEANTKPDPDRKIDSRAVYERSIGELNRPLGPEEYPGARNPATIFAVALLGLIIGAGIGNLVYRFFERTGERWDKMESGDKVTLFLGIFAGIIASVPFLFIFTGLGNVIAPLATLGLTIGFSSMAVYALRSMDEFLPWQRNKGRSRRSGIKILDTNVIIDGRVYDVARSGFLDGQLYVPNFVLDELQHIADSADPLRRQRGRRGLDVLRHMQADFQMEVGTHDRLSPDLHDGVDARLVRLAKAIGGDIVTNDFNLNRVAALQQVNVLNLNDLALALKPNVLPREPLTITIVREGNQPGQGVGYLDDGTMVVVEQGRRHMNETMQVIVTQVIQTERGKMIFAEVPEEDEPEPEARRRRAKGSV